VYFYYQFEFPLVRRKRINIQIIARISKGGETVGGHMNGAVYMAVRWRGRRNSSRKMGWGELIYGTFFPWPVYSYYKICEAKTIYLLLLQLTITKSLYVRTYAVQILNAKLHSGGPVSNLLPESDHFEREFSYVEFEVFTAVVMKSIIFWDVTPCNLFATCLLAGYCWNYFFDREDGGDMFLRNVGCNSTDYTASHPRRWYSSWIFIVFLSPSRKISGQYVKNHYRFLRHIFQSIVP
jgi:hypothetical protein